MKYIEQLLSNRCLWVSLLAFSIAQLTKVTLNLIKNKKITFERFIGSGGMPSSHSAFVVAMATSVGKSLGFDSPFFAMCAVVSFVVMYDAAGVRRAAGNQAVVINLILDIVESQGLKVDKKLKELLGHSPIEVFAGALLGMILGIVL